MTYEVRLAGLGNVPQPNLDALVRVHQGLTYQNGILAGEAEIPEEFLAQDISFALTNDIPAENTASRLETYQPRNITQADLLDKAYFLSQARGRFMGLIALGDAGVGKSHVAIGLAKTLEMNGQASRYIHVPRIHNMMTTITPNPDETLILDDLNEPYGWGRQNFSNVITGMHHNGSGRLFITSNVLPKNYDKYIIDMISARGLDDPEAIRIIDRAGAALRTVAVQGESYRHSQNEDPWADYRPGGSALPIEG